MSQFGKRMDHKQFDHNDHSAILGNFIIKSWIIAHSSLMLLYHTLPLFPKHFSTTLFPNTISSPTLLYHTLPQHNLCPNTSLQHSSPTLLYHTLPQHFSRTFFWCCWWWLGGRGVFVVFWWSGFGVLVVMFG